MAVFEESMMLIAEDLSEKIAALMEKEGETPEIELMALCILLFKSAEDLGFTVESFYDEFMRYSHHYQTLLKEGSSEKETDEFV